ncbi:MAG: hypothetical protein AAB424_02965 [Patescibacteria group bacterium]
MYRRVTIAILMAIVALSLVAGCNKQEIADLKTQIADKDNILVSTNSENAILRENLARVNAERVSVMQERDSLQKIVQTHGSENAQLRTTLGQVKAQATHDLKEFADATVIFHDRQVTCEATDDSLRHELLRLSATNDSCTISLNACDQFSTDINQWREYYELESHRSWWKKFWGAGKHTPPPFPDPTHETFLSR